MIISNEEAMQKMHGCIVLKLSCKNNNHDA